MKITVYSKPNCMQCVATQKALTAKGIAFDVVSLNDNQQAMDRVTALGYRQVPVVVAGEDHWSGFRPDRIGQL
ncbi:glutaredoxin-like protein NrdH [Vibrio mimicus]|uniref:glutaredoxin-like protein NrdH n=1 Tax=Vibrio mimicus TaxID=674 RepID=UPI0002BC56D5|nr:glutaredoxin-like protein NrdH [Vibrio mimicus]ERM56479.1 glutaredoxin [Vibrio mimicus CAIM 1883]ERM56660.1 glutaredoxin [Vibrio mimicus CAIM 1882]EMB51212.1 ribonucleoside-diphosphate reductase class Ib glutaredoxin subunit [Vibrio mimicus CAIM 602]MBY7674754.1 glutaredoxin-like protein NrdH [Vibrio mimicus]MBY7726615.1 glutaredoxin-like protein NrdH [Vibrio mimicus]